MKHRVSIWREAEQNLWRRIDIFISAFKVKKNDRFQGCKEPQRLPSSRLPILTYEENEPQVSCYLSNVTRVFFISCLYSLLYYFGLDLSSLRTGTLAFQTALDFHNPCLMRELMDINWPSMLPFCKSTLSFQFPYTMQSKQILMKHVSSHDFMEETNR